MNELAMCTAFIGTKERKKKKKAKSTNHRPLKREKERKKGKTHSLGYSCTSIDDLHIQLVLKIAFGKNSRQHALFFLVSNFV